MNMFRYSMGLGLALIVALYPGFARAGILPGAPAQPDPFTINFDENGNATVSVYQGSSYSETGYMALDHSGAFPGVNVLTYNLPEQIGPGGVNILDSSGAISDNLYFYDDANGGHMQYMSQLGGGALADTGVANFGYSPTSENANETFTFVAGSGDPSTTNFYNGISSVPEPGSLTLAGLGIAGLVGYSWRRRKMTGSVR
jgi:hypothetical protein